jgi:uncharacterized protein (DUF58 family)
MIPQEVLRKVRRIEILTGRLVSETFAGDYLSVFKGRGMEFSEVREYSAGDDVRTIDWNVTARTGHPFVRQYTEERELTVVIACDLSGSQFFGTAAQLKNEISAELSAVLAFCALQNHDKVGMFLFTEGVESFVQPKKGRKHVLHLIRDVLAYKPAKRGTNIGAALDTINRVLKRRAILFVISDFRDDRFERQLRMAALKHDVIPVVVTDPRELKLPRASALVELQDPETGGSTVVDLSRSSAVSAYEKTERERQAELDRTFQKSGLLPIRVGTDRSYIDAVVQFFRLRARRLRH